MNFGLCPQEPDREASMRDSKRPSHPLHPSIEVAVAEKASNKRGYFILSNARHNQAIASMPQAGVIEARVAGEKSGVAVLAQQDDNLLVLQTFAAKVDSNLPRGQPPPFEHETLSVEDVLVEDDQA